LAAQTIAALINALVGDLAEASAARIARSGARSIDEVRQTREPLIGFSPETAARFLTLKRFLSERLYHHPRVLERNEPAEHVIGELFESYAADAARLPDSVRARFDEDGRERAIADYIAGMTDLFHSYVSEPGQLPPHYQEQVTHDGVHRVVCDYIAGMTDRFALGEQRRLAEAS
jgi:dGTPase